MHRRRRRLLLFGTSIRAERDEGRQRQYATVPGADPQYPAEDIPGPTMTGGARVKYPAKIVVLVRPLVLGKGQNVLDWITLR